MGCWQVEGRDYEETYAPVVRSDTSRILIAFSAKLGYIDTAVPYEPMNRLLYTIQPQGFEQGNGQLFEISPERILMVWWSERYLKRFWPHSVKTWWLFILQNLLQIIHHPLSRYKLKDIVVQANRLEKLARSLNALTQWLIQILQLFDLVYAEIPSTPERKNEQCARSAMACLGRSYHQCWDQYRLINLKKYRGCHQHSATDIWDWAEQS